LAVNTGQLKQNDKTFQKIFF